MKKWFRYLAVGVFLLPLVVGANLNAETITWIGSTTWKGNDSTGAVVTGTFTAAEMLTMKYFVRANKTGVAPRVYIGETGNGITTWTDNVMVKMGAAGITVAPGDVVDITVSQAFKDTGGEQDSPESAIAKWTIPGKPVVTPPTNRGCSTGPSGVAVK